jgi:hypothetical protein
MGELLPAAVLEYKAGGLVFHGQGGGKRRAASDLVFQKIRLESHRTAAMLLLSALNRGRSVFTLWSFKQSER